MPTTPTFLDGVTLAVNSVPDIHVILNCPSCGLDKPGKVAVNHDWGSRMLDIRHRHHFHYTTLEANDLVLGSEARVVRTARSVAKQTPSLVLLVDSSATLLMGDDLEATCAEMERETGIPMAVIPSATLSGDWLDGYAVTAETLARLVQPGNTVARPGTVAMVGFLFDRFEGDARANAEELRRLLAGLGLEAIPGWLDGSEWSQVNGLAQAERIVAMPWARGSAAVLARRLGRPVVEVGAPVGLEGTASWVRAVAAACGRGDAAEDFIDREIGNAVRRLEWPVRNTIANRGIAIVADPYVAEGLIQFVTSMGMQVRSVALHTRKLAAAKATEDALEVAGQSQRVLVDPSYAELESEWSRLNAEGRLDVIVGTGNERDAAKMTGLPYLELGFPCYLRHAIFDAPWAGFRGALWLADRLVQLLMEREYLSY